MPIYDYACEAHGEFELSRPMSRCSEPAECPVCGTTARRVITAPHLASLSPQKRSAMERNERSRHAPHVCGAGCGHHHAAPSKAKAASALTADGKPKLQAYKGPRPWVVEHR